MNHATGTTAPRRHLVRPLTVAWLVHGELRRRGEAWVSDLASVRYRATIPGAALAGRGHTVRLVPVAGAFDPAALMPRLEADVVVVGKSFRRETETLVIEAKRRGARILVDLCDDHFQAPDLAAHQHALVGLADALVVSTPELARVVRSATGREAQLAPDPYEGPHGVPRFAPLPGERPRLLWFGHPLNLDTLTRSLPSLITLGERVPLALTVVTSRLPGLAERFDAFNAAHGARLRVTVVPWSLDVTWSELAACDLVVIPSLGGDRRKHVKSPNRLVESLRAGRHAVAYPLPSYEEFARYATLEPNVADGIARVLAAPHGVEARIEAGQRHVEAACSPDRAAEAWERALMTALGARRAPHATGAPPVSRVETAELPRRVIERVRAQAEPSSASRAEPRDLGPAAGTTGATGRFASAPAGNAALGLPGAATPAATPAPASARTATRGQVATHLARVRGPVRLNLGCGDKIMPGWINVDLVDGRLGHRPDILCDVRDLSPFPDGVADEMLAVHLVEHIWRREIVQVLRGWARVLKPGGRLIVECPNLLEACREFLEDPLRAAGPGACGQRTMWVFYGDPRWKDPYMCHRWGYTPESLGAILVEAGLVRVRQEPAEFKLREPRDMRVVGERP